jgi:RimJ/RimL family protein N-acetyltransferase
MKATIKRPSECSQQELEAFEALVRKGEEVALEGLSGRIIKAAFLVFLTELDGSLVGVSALKHPNPGYRRGVFQKSNSSLNPEDYDFELGWIFVAEPHRGQGLSHTLVEKLLLYAGAKKIYATTRESNLPMRHTNQRFGFKLEGSQYPTENGDYILELYVYSPS